jgi:hypothetical protein
VNPTPHPLDPPLTYATINQSNLAVVYSVTNFYIARFWYIALFVFEVLMWVCFSTTVVIKNIAKIV